LKAALCSAVQPALLCASTGLPRSNSISSACSAQVTRVGVCAGPDVVVAVVAVSTDRHFACICHLGCQLACSRGCRKWLLGRQRNVSPLKRRYAFR
jgi:hypothetical protein